MWATVGMVWGRREGGVQPAWELREGSVRAAWSGRGWRGCSVVAVWGRRGGMEAGLQQRTDGRRCGAAWERREDSVKAACCAVGAVWKRRGGVGTV